MYNLYFCSYFLNSVPILFLLFKFYINFLVWYIISIFVPSFLNTWKNREIFDSPFFSFSLFWTFWGHLGPLMVIYYRFYPRANTSAIIQHFINFLRTVGTLKKDNFANIMVIFLNFWTRFAPFFRKNSVCFRLKLSFLMKLYGF